MIRSTLLLLLVLVVSCHAFSTIAPVTTTRRQRATVSRRFNTDSDTSDTGDEPVTKMSLEEKMKSWEASDEEIKAASLGGIMPVASGEERSDAFDVGLYIAFPIMVLSGLAFALFPFIIGNIDVDSVGPPPSI